VLVPVSVMPFSGIASVPFDFLPPTAWNFRCRWLVGELPVSVVTGTTKGPEGLRSLSAWTFAEKRFDRRSGGEGIVREIARTCSPSCVAVVIVWGSQLSWSGR